MSGLLIADQSPALAREIAIAAHAHGLPVVGVTRDGLDTVEQAVRLQPTHLVLDLLLPRLAGAQVLASLRRQGLTTRVVVVSAVSAREAILAARAAGAIAYLLKPLAVPRLVELLVSQREAAAAVAG
jgi:DNA-binding NarL/FixJ family response regulator